MKAKHFILSLLALLNSITLSAEEFWTDSNGTTWCFEIWGGEATLIQEAFDDDLYPCVSGGPSDLTIPSKVYVDERAYTVTAIGVNAFKECNITSIIIPNTITSIGVGAFSGCYNLTSITIPESVTYIGGGAFSGCTNLTSITIPESVTYIGSDAFDGTGWYNNQPEGMIYVGKVAYKYKGTMPEGSHITINEGTYSIAENAFYDCNGLTSVIIPENVKIIGSMAFDCRNLSSVTMLNPTPISIGSAFSYSSLSTLHVPTGSETAYQSKSGWKDFGTITAIDEAILNTAGNLSNVVKTSVTELKIWGDLNGTDIKCLRTLINDYSLTCLDLSKARIVEGGEAYYYYMGGYYTANDEFGANFFHSCANLTSIVLPESVTSIGESAFCDCFNLSSVSIPNSVTSIGSSAFYDCDNLSSIVIPESVTSIGSYCFFYCYSLGAIVIPDGVTSIGNSMFYHCTSLSSVTIPSSVTSIGELAFYECRSLTSINIPEDVTSIGRNAFNGCTRLISVVIPEGITTIEDYVFANCSYLTSVVIPEGVTSIGDYAFSNCCNYLRSVTIPSSVTSIGQNAFAGCGRMTMVNVYRENPPSINSNSFTNRSDATLYVPNGCKAAYEAADYWNEFKEIIEINTINVGSTGLATYCSPNALDFSGVTDIKAYVASDFDSGTNTLTLTRVTEVPAGEGLYIVGTAGSYEIPETTTGAVYSNLLKGVTRATTIYPTETSNNTNFILSNGSYGVGFYTLSAEGELAGGKAYLQLPTASVAGVKALNLVFDDDDATGINSNPVLSKVEGAIYNIAGQRIRTIQKGLYIIDSKKIFIK